MTMCAIQKWTLKNIIILLSLSVASSKLLLEDELTTYREQKARLLDFSTRILHSEAIEACEADAEENEDNLEDIGLECECKRRRDGVILICVDECAYCNEDETVCGIQSAQAFYEHDNGERSAIGGVFEYVTGLRDTLAVENLGCVEENGSIVSCDSCNVYVNGEECNSCELIDCGDGTTAENIDCENIESDATFDFCGPVQIDDGVFQALSTTGFEDCLPLDVLGKGKGGKRSKGSKRRGKGKGGKGSRRGGHDTPLFQGSDSSSSRSGRYYRRSAKKRKSRRGLVDY